MTGHERARATIRTAHEDGETIAAAIAPDNTAEMETTVEGRGIRTRIARDSTAGLRSTTDDYVVNLAVAIETVALADGTDESEESNDGTTAADDTQS
ncbi:KEOPS complex subunit Pcc1 [Saliphagus sp. LR7]|uniref:KEOPS complex subunit Pcc1 n=1 Tax=Saliphagus sp. LR7 TaxID=2282654 RepID=UPI000DF85643|nr:KEOPS complex subunit Pcc1 [Saliphagus sp. LR7]